MNTYDWVLLIISIICFTSIGIAANYSRKAFNKKQNELVYGTFILKFEHWDFIQECFYVMYSNDNGKTFDYIMIAQAPSGNSVLFDWKLIACWGNNQEEAKKFSKKFSSYEKVIEFQKQQFEIYEQGVLEHRKRKAEYEKSFNKIKYF